MKGKHIVMLVSSVLLAGQSAYADDVVCPASLGPVTIDGNVIVVGQCELDRTTVKGNVLLEAGGDLLARQARIIGNVQTDGAVRVRLRLTEIDGDVQLTGVFGSRNSSVVNSDIGGTLDIEDNQSRFVLRRNIVDSDLKANKNTGGVLIRDNTVGGNLQCQDNVPAPAGGNNTVDGSKENQCENL